MSTVDRIYFDTEGVQLRDGSGLYWRDFRNIALMQSTGLFDKNGVEIFEGDVAVMDGRRRQVVTFGTQEVEEEFGSVRIYRGFNLYLGGGYPNAVMSEFEVVGNIYENQELVEGNA
ncbi:YopX family protein [uncultured Streptococcus sp.]|uniref:YopX family protein n=1 Tax=uncultured Streptococcus sp. TaxID=83427 RepID=UPI00280BA47A|nr:YopX family protein [uncultured Streptococcus sp.]